MPVQIANPAVVTKVERLARSTGLSKTAAVERAVDRMLLELDRGVPGTGRIDALLDQLDRVHDRPDAYAALDWDAHGLPR